MKSKISILVIMFSLIMSIAFAQEKTKKEKKEEAKLEKQKQIEDLINVKAFDFIAKMVIPSGYKTINLPNTSNFMKFRSNMIESYLPFYGTAYSGVGYGGDDGMKFTGMPEDFTITKGKKNYRCTAIVKVKNETFRISLTVSFEGSSTLTITSTNRSIISYSGDIIAPEVKKQKK